MINISVALKSWMFWFPKKGERQKSDTCPNILSHIQIQNTDFKQLYFVNIFSYSIPLLHIFFYLEMDWNYFMQY